MDNIKEINLGEISYGESRNGTSYEGLIYMDGNTIGYFDNEGRGGITEVNIDTQFRNDFNDRVNLYFKEIGFDITNSEEYSKHYTFIEHLIDVKETGKVSELSLELEFFV
jgi:hypothetical protein